MPQSTAQQAGDGNLTQLDQPGLRTQLSQLRILCRHYWDGAEDQIETLLKFYGLQSLSMRQALHHKITREPFLKELLWWPPPSDLLHPTCLGHKCAPLLSASINCPSESARWLNDTCTAHLPGPQARGPTACLGCAWHTVQQPAGGQ